MKKWSNWAINPPIAMTTTTVAVSASEHENSGGKHSLDNLLDPTKDIDNKTIHDSNYVSVNFEFTDQ